MRHLPAGAAVRVRSPASAANLGPGFDSVGLALGLWDEYDVVVTRDAGLLIEVSGEAAGDVPTDESHLVHRSMVRTFRELGVVTPPGLHVLARNGVPHGRGLGSSATAIVAGVVAAQGLGALAASARRDCGTAVPVDLARANNLASELEGHPDNASASVFGGMTLSWTADPGTSRAGETSTVSLTVHPTVTAVVFLPEARLATHAARAVLPAWVAHRDAALNSARAALLVEAATRRPDLLLPATRDWLHQEARRASFAPSMALVDSLRSDGHAAVISGAGPSVLVLTTAGDAAQVLPRGGVAGWRRLEPGIPAAGATVTQI